ncbi:unnamed protein product [Rotaria socialis]|uniref:Uncharacterized protein n=3 Tax=Rotaria socialis TaxID=392032 RepID=A0A818YDR9_9BILA|nr:unnamed protein product [Rotaria socialis]CAF3751961.1 unnamed protein product [Rotaria socialis]CAF4217982.1 unnamed protein product [Rotaria socialis]CAF4517330.1 unnamed protein product [Rotaria socialis]
MAIFLTKSRESLLLDSQLFTMYTICARPLRNSDRQIICLQNNASLDGSMTSHAHDTASIWDPTYTSTPWLDDLSPFSKLNPTTLSYGDLADTLSSDLESTIAINYRSLHGFINLSSNFDSTSTYAM